MNNSLDVFLTNIGASQNEHHHSQFNDAVTAPACDNIISPLSHYGLLAIDGPDTAKFLQGQTTCDLKKVDPTTSIEGGCCTVQGRLYSSFHLAQLSSEQYRLRIRKDIVEDTQQRLAKYIVFSKAEQNNLTDSHLVIGMKGPQAKANIETVFGGCPASANESLATDAAIIICLGDESYECWLSISDAEMHWQALANQLTAIGSNHWELLTIERGIAEITALTQDMFIPQMLNQQITGAVSFTKGCYTGQEIVARMQYKGKLKRRMYRIGFSSDQPVQPGDDISTAQGKSIGNIVNVNRNDQYFEALAVITSDQIDNSDLTLTKNQTNLEILSLPYAINTEG